MTAGQVAALIDHTRLTAEATRQDIDELCREAVAFRFATVCINPTWVAAASGVLAGSRIGVCTVVGFPLGAATVEVKAFEARCAIADGADEIDMVINIGALRSGDLDTVRRDMDGVITACRERGATSKVIIEAGLLSRDEKVTASAMAKVAGADFVKTSTGFGGSGATAADVALIRSVVGPAMGIKAAGGIRNLAAFEAMVAAGATRIGASAGVVIVQEARAAQDQAHR